MNAQPSRDRQGRISKAIGVVCVVGFVAYVLIRTVLNLGKGQQA